MKLWLNATVIQFREREVGDKRWTHASLRVQTFKGCLLGYADTDGFDLVAAFPNDTYAQRFLNAYFDGDADQVVAYVIGCEQLETVPRSR